MTDGRSVDALTTEDFREIRGSLFRLTATTPAGMPDVSLELDLVDVTEHGSGPPGAFRAPFSALFHGPLTPVMPQGIYRLEHERLGALDLFIVPVGPDTPAEPGQPPTAMRYEAVFG